MWERGEVDAEMKPHDEEYLISNLRLRPARSLKSMETIFIPVVTGPTIDLHCLAIFLLVASIFFTFAFVWVTFH
jgi:hypothetical protein